jgi:hypothetical protein
LHIDDRKAGQYSSSKDSHYKAGRRKAYLITLFLLAGYLILLGYGMGTPRVTAASKQVTYTIKTTSAPAITRYQSLATYNNKTKHYYLLRSYLELLEKKGGGTLILKKGTYTITNTLYVSSKVTIVLQDGVTLRKGNDTGTKALSPTKSLFQFIAPSKSGQSAVAAKYGGVSDIKLIGEGTAIIDLNYENEVTGIVIGHSSNITIEGITFQKMKGGSFLKIAASKKVAIKNNIFCDAKASSSGRREAIALEIPDETSKGFIYPWSKADKTVNDDITIENNEFSSLERAIGSGKYTQDVYQRNIKLLNNTITKTTSHAVRILNWEKCVVEGNHFSNITNSEGSLKVIQVSGAKYPTITGNIFANSDRPIQIMPSKNTNNGSGYATTYNTISEVNKAAMVNNTLLEMKEYIIRYHKTYNEFTKDTEKWEIFDVSVKAFTITPDSQPFQNNFTNYSTYNKETKQYYVLRSYLEQLEKVGGGTLTINAGTYEISNALYVASNITIYLKDGVIIRKSAETGTNLMESASSLFQLVAPSRASIVGGYSAYQGESNIKLIGEGSATIDMNYVSGAIGIILAHNREITIQGIAFTNMQSGHFIELDASKNVLIEKNTFTGHKPSETGIKEAINLDTPDISTGGIHVGWTSYDLTPNLEVTIRDNHFSDLERAIGTHKYSGGRYHENIKILNNIIEDTDSDAIRILNWKTPTIQGNTIRNVNNGSGTERAILASGVIHPIIQNNTFINTARPIQLMPWKNNGPGSDYDITYNEVDSKELELMLKNSLERVGESFIRVNQVYGVYNTSTLKYYYSSVYIR